MKDRKLILISKEEFLRKKREAEKDNQKAHFSDKLEQAGWLFE